MGLEAKLGGLGVDPHQLVGGHLPGSEDKPAAHALPFPPPPHCPLSHCISFLPSPFAPFLRDEICIDIEV